MASHNQGVSGIAGRYAAALFELADERKRLDEVAADLRDLKAMIAASHDLDRLVRSPVLTRADQAAAMSAVLGKAGASELTRNFISLVARNRRLFALPAMIDGYLTMLAQHRGEVTADVTAAARLSDSQTAALSEALRNVLGAKVAVNLKVDPAIIGGLIVKVGSRLFDSSLRTKLHKLELAMKGIG
ncbi:MAG: F0F1 ATP synthase subunit delta [Alphaproteobacteria bacterium]